MKFSPSIPMARWKKRLVNGRVVLEADRRTREIIADWRRTELPLMKIRGLAESAAVGGRHKVSADKLVETFRAAKRRLVQLGGRQARRSDWSRGIGVEVIAEVGHETLRERMRLYPTLTLTEEIAAGALGVRDLKEAVALSSHTQITRPQRAAEKHMRDSEKGVGPKSPFEEMHDEQTAINSKNPVVRKNLLAMGVARRRQAYATSVAQQSHEGEKGMSMVDDDRADVGGRSAYTYTGEPEHDDLRVDLKQKRVADMLDEEEGGHASEDEGGEEESHSPSEAVAAMKSMMVELRDVLDDADDQETKTKVRTAIQSLAAAIELLGGEAEGSEDEDEDEDEAMDHGSKALDTYANEDEDEDEIERAIRDREGHGGSGGDGVPEPPAKGERYGKLRQPAGRRGVGTRAIELEDGEVPRKPGSSPMPGRGGLLRYPGEPKPTKQAKREAARRVIEDLKPFSSEYSMLRRMIEEE